MIKCVDCKHKDLHGDSYIKPLYCKITGANVEAWIKRSPPDCPIKLSDKGSK